MDAPKQLIVVEHAGLAWCFHVPQQSWSETNPVDCGTALLISPDMQTVLEAANDINHDKLPVRTKLMDGRDVTVIGWTAPEPYDNSRWLPIAEWENQKKLRLVKIDDLDMDERITGEDFDAIAKARGTKGILMLRHEL